MDFVCVGCEGRTVDGVDESQSRSLHCESCVGFVLEVPLVLRLSSS